jgi:hypothetical protein
MWLNTYMIFNQDLNIMLYEWWNDIATKKYNGTDLLSETHLISHVTNSDFNSVAMFQWR